MALAPPQAMIKRSFSALQTIGGRLVIEDNAALTRLGGLEQVCDVGEDLVVDNNAALSDISSIFGLCSVGGDATITDNPSLPTPEAQQVIDTIGAFSGVVTISGNGWARCARRRLGLARASA